MNDGIQARLRALPSVDALLANNALQRSILLYSHAVVVQACRAVLSEAREQIRQGAAVTDLAQQVQQQVERLVAPTLVRVINATGVVIHTNLGRAPLSEAALAAMHEVGSGYSNLEFDLGTGRRGGRDAHAAARLAALTGAEAALVVNNNAAALVLTLAALAAGREVIMSRAHLVEIGGGFRIPDIMRQGGATLREVGTTNRTYLHDYTGAITGQSALFMRLHPSNFRIEGFVHQPPLAELAEAAHAHGLWLVDDLGSGALLDTRPFGLAQEPLVQASIAAGADLVLFSGDKLLGGPQAGCIVGRKALVALLRRHPLARALRVDKATLAALDATLMSYQRGRALEEVPIWRMIARPVQELEVVARRWAATLQAVGIAAEVQPGHSTIGGGSLPGETLPTWLLALPHAHPDRLATTLRAHRPPLVARIADDALLLDPRTILPEQEPLVLDALLTLHGSQDESPTS